MDRFNISLQSGEKGLIDWIRERMKNNEISPSLIFRDAMLEKKKEWDVIHSENPASLHKTVNDLRKTLEQVSQKINAFIDKRGLTEEWFDFYNDKNNLKKKQKGFVKEIIESEKIKGIAQ